MGDQLPRPHQPKAEAEPKLRIASNPEFRPSSTKHPHPAPHPAPAAKPLANWPAYRAMLVAMPGSSLGLAVAALAILARVSSAHDNPNPAFPSDSDSLFWGPYKPNLYFGIRPRAPDGVWAGLMWSKFNKPEDLSRRKWPVSFSPPSFVRQPVPTAHMPRIQIHVRAE